MPYLAIFSFGVTIPRRLRAKLGRSLRRRPVCESAIVVGTQCRNSALEQRPPNMMAQMGMPFVFPRSASASGCCMVFTSTPQQIHPRHPRKDPPLWDPLGPWTIHGAQTHFLACFTAITGRFDTPSLGILRQFCVQKRGQGVQLAAN